MLFCDHELDHNIKLYIKYTRNNLSSFFLSHSLTLHLSLSLSLSLMQFLTSHTHFVRRNNRAAELPSSVHPVFYSLSHTSSSLHHFIAEEEVNMNYDFIRFILVTFLCLSPLLKSHKWQNILVKCKRQDPLNTFSRFARKDPLRTAICIQPATDTHAKVGGKN